MMQKSDGKIGSREFFILVQYAMAIELSDMTPTFLFKEGKTATWMIPILAGAVLIVPFLVLMNIIKKFRNKGLIDIIYSITGRYAGFIINVVLFFIMFSALFLNSRNYVDIMQVMFFPRTPAVAIYSILMGSAYFIANRGLETLARTAWIFYPYILAVLILIIIMAFSEVDIQFIYPFWGPGIKELVMTSVEHSPIVGDIILLTVLFPFSRSHKEFKTPVLLGFLASILQLSLLILYYTCVYDYPTVENVAFPFHQLIMLISAGRFFTNIEAFFLFFWVITSILRFALYLYLTAAIFGYTLRLNEFEPLLLPFAGLTVMLGGIPKNYIENAFVYRQGLLIQKSWIVFIFLPFILRVVLKFRGDKTT